jgi:hypothetical protein
MSAVGNIISKNAVGNFRQLFLPAVRSDVRSALPQGNRIFGTLTNRGRIGNLRPTVREITRKISPNAALVTGGAVTIAGLSQTPASVENIKNASEAVEASAEASAEFGKAASNFGDFIQKNPLIVYGGLALIGTVIIISLVKK